MRDHCIAVYFRLGRSKERLAETEGDRTSDTGQLEVQQAGQRPDGPADQGAGVTHHVESCLLGRAPGDGLDGRTRCLCLQAAVRPARAEPTIRHDVEVANVPSVTSGTIEQAAVEHDAAPNAG